MLQTIGSDMEVFGKSKLGDHIALCGMIGGSKEEPIPMKGMPSGFMLQEDNVALEFNIPVCTNVEQFVNSFAMARKHIKEVLDGLNIVMSTEASVSFDKMQLIHPQALVFGCEPDYDAWSKTENEKPYCSNECLRTAGGHIHVGTDKNMIDGVQAMDLLLGVPSVLIDDKPSSIERRKLYGKPGAMRPKPYGFEYRVLSNFWMFKDELVQWVYQQTERAMNFNAPIKEGLAETIRECITTGNKAAAEKLVRNFKIAMPA